MYNLIISICSILSKTFQETVLVVSLCKKQEMSNSKFNSWFLHLFLWDFWEDAILITFTSFFTYFLYMEYLYFCYNESEEVITCKYRTRCRIEVCGRSFTPKVILDWYNQLGIQLIRWYISLTTLNIWINDISCHDFTTHHFQVPTFSIFIYCFIIHFGGFRQLILFLARNYP